MIFFRKMIIYTLDVACLDSCDCYMWSRLLCGASEEEGIVLYNHEILFNT